MTRPTNRSVLVLEVITCPSDHTQYAKLQGDANLRRLLIEESDISKPNQAGNGAKSAKSDCLRADEAESVKLIADAGYVLQAVSQSGFCHPVPPHYVWYNTKYVFDKVDVTPEEREEGLRRELEELRASSSVAQAELTRTRAELHELRGCFEHEVQQRRAAEEDLSGLRGDLTRVRLELEESRTVANEQKVLLSHQDSRITETADMLMKERAERIKLSDFLSQQSETIVQLDLDLQRAEAKRDEAERDRRAKERQLTRVARGAPVDATPATAVASAPSAGVQHTGPAPAVVQAPIESCEELGGATGALAQPGPQVPIEVEGSHASGMP